MKLISGGVCAAKGFTANGVHCGIRKNRTKRDLALIYSETPATAAAVSSANIEVAKPRDSIASDKRRVEILVILFINYPCRSYIYNYDIIIHIYYRTNSLICQ